MSTDMAEPSPKFQVDERRVVDVDRDDVRRVRSDVPNSTNGVVKSLNVHRNSTRISTWLTGRSDGM